MAVSRNNAGLSRERIVAEALRIIDGMGLRSLTMRRLGDASTSKRWPIYHPLPAGRGTALQRIGVHQRPARALASRSETAPEMSYPQNRSEPEPRPWDQRLRGLRLPCRLLRHRGAAFNPPPSRHGGGPHAPRNCTMRRLSRLPPEEVPGAAAALTSYVLGAVIHQVRSEGLPSSDRRPRRAVPTVGVELDRRRPRPGFPHRLDAPWRSHRPGPHGERWPAKSTTLVSPSRPRATWPPGPGYAGPAWSESG